MAQPGTQEAPPPESELAPILAGLNLSAVKSRAMELYAAIGRLRDAFHPQQAATLKWPDILNQFAVLNTQLLNLVADMKPLLRMYVVYPKAGGVGAETAPILPLMLSTKLLPEMEKERASLQEDVEAKMGLLPPGGGQTAGIPTPLQAQISRLQQQIDAVRSTCDAANRTIQNERRTLHQQALSAYQTPAKPDPSLLAKEKLLRNAVLSGEGLRVPDTPPNRERVLPPHLARVLPPAGGGASRGGRPPLPSLRAGATYLANPLSLQGEAGGKAPAFKLPSPRIPSPYALGSPRATGPKPA